MLKSLNKYRQKIYLESYPDFFMCVLEASRLFSPSCYLNELLELWFFFQEKGSGWGCDGCGQDGTGKERYRCAEGQRRVLAPSRKVTYSHLGKRNVIFNNLSGGFKYFLFSLLLREMILPILTNIFQMGWNHQPVMHFGMGISGICWFWRGYCSDLKIWFSFRVVVIYWMETT